ncbi:MAG: hypothetical protein U1E76_18070 [Planctomycetota bacterium]
MSCLTSLLLALAAGAATAPAEDDLGAAKALRILYAGPSGTDRAEAFVRFLREHFTTVDSIDIEKLSAAAAKDADVVVADGPRLYPMDDKSPLRTPRVEIGPEFIKPIVTISAVGGTIQHHTKIDWL